MAANLAVLGLASEMRHGPFVATPKCFAVVVGCIPGHIRMTVFVAVIWVGAAVVVIVPASAFDSIPIAALLDFAEFRGRSVPATPTVIAH